MKWAIAGVVGVVVLAFVVSYWRDLNRDEPQPINQEVEEMLRQRESEQQP